MNENLKYFDQILTFYPQVHPYNHRQITDGGTHRSQRPGLTVLFASSRVPYGIDP